MESLVPQAPSWIWSPIFLILLTGINMLGAKGFGEAEFWLALIKVLAIVIFLIVAILILAGVFTGQGAIGLTNWTIPYAPIVPAFDVKAPLAIQAIISILKVFTTAIFAYG